MEPAYCGTCIHKLPPPVRILSQINPVHATSHFLEIHFNVILPPTPRSSTWTLSVGSPHQNTLHTPSVCRTCHMPSPSFFSWFVHPNNWWGVQIKKFQVLHSSSLTCHLVALGPKYLSQHNVLEHSQHVFSVYVSDQFSHPYKTTDTVMVLFESWKELPEPKMDKMSSCVPIPDRPRDFLRCRTPIQSLRPMRLIQRRVRGGGLKWPEREVTTQFYPVPRWRMSEAVLLFLHTPSWRTQGRHRDDVNKKRYFVTYLVVYTCVLGSRITVLGMWLRKVWCKSGNISM